MTLDVFRAKRLYFSAEAFLTDMGRQPKENDWIYKMDGRPIVQSKTYPAGGGNGTSVTLGRIKGYALLGVSRMVSKRRRVKKCLKKNQSQ